jgi:hypothetical protein
MRRREFIGLRLSESESNLTLSEKCFCRQSGDMWCFDRTNIWNCSPSADRRELLWSIAGVTIIWAGSIIAQPADRVRRIGIFHAYEEVDPEERLQISAFREELSKLGWVEGRKSTFWLAPVSPTCIVCALTLPIARELLAKKPDVVCNRPQSWRSRS